MGYLGQKTSICTTQPVMPNGTLFEERGFCLNCNSAAWWNSLGSNSRLLRVSRVPRPVLQSLERGSAPRAAVRNLLSPAAWRPMCSPQKLLVSYLTMLQKGSLNKRHFYRFSQSTLDVLFSLQSEINRKELSLW